MKITRQRDTMDCGPSCLAMIAKHYGLHSNIAKIRRSCALNKAAVSLLGISKVAKSIGFKTIGRRLTFNTLAKEVTHPCIIR